MEFKAFENTAGQGLASIRICEIGSYFRLSKPIAVAWEYDSGTSERFLCQLPYDEQERKAIIRQMNEGLYNDYTNNLDALKTLLDPLLAAFPKGYYTLRFHDGEKGDYFRVYRYDDEGAIEWNFIETTFITDINSTEEKRRAHEAYVAITGKLMARRLIERTTFAYYEGIDVNLIATQPKHIINEERVKFFEEQIARGERPFAIIFRCEYRRGDDQKHRAASDRYVIDGHHKLLAYQRQKVAPRIAELIHHAETREEVNFDMEELLGALYPWQIEHIMHNWGAKGKFIAAALKNPESKLHAYVKSGWIREYYGNGQLRQEAFYVLDKMEGTEKVWYHNGQLASVRNYKDGWKTGEEKSWYSSGQLQFTGSYNEWSREHGEMIAYYENGNMRYRQLMEHGAHVDGQTHTTWYENGVVEHEYEYRNQQGYSRTAYDTKGVFMAYEEWDPITGKLVRKR